MGIFKLTRTQEIPASMQDVWDFVSSPKNLKQITPSYMGFDIINKDLPDKMYPGMMIEYTVQPVLGIRLRWLTEITQVQELKFFVDEQRSGPYKLWHHEHHFKQTPKGVLMTDIVHYVPPMGLLGSMANSLFIKRKLEEIFDFRTVAMEKRF